MKKIIKIISVLVVAIIISAIVYVKTNSNNDTVKMQNKEALGTKFYHMYVPCDDKTGPDCEWDDGSRHHKLTNAVYTG